VENVPVFTNKHIIIALLVTPVLAILAWFAVGAFVGEEPQQAAAGQSYPLVERSNCRYDSGQCDLRNEDMRLSITFASTLSGPNLLLTSSHALDYALLGVAADGEDSKPISLRKQDSQGLQWILSLDELPSRDQRLQIVVNAGGSNWFADTSTVFLDPYREQASGE
jgi:hypothetical protein